MKRIIFFILSFIISFSLFSQQEIWGFRSFGGEIGGGLVFKLDLENDSAETIHRFDYTTGYKGYVDSNNPLVDGGNGLLYSTAAILELNQYYGSQNSLFSYKPENNEMNLVSDIPDDASIVFADTVNHIIYFWNNGSGTSKISKYDIENNEFSIIQEYDETYGTDISGDWTEIDDKYYFFNQYGGEYNKGTFLEFDPVSKQISKILDFNEIVFPQGSLISHPNGFYYGVTKRGGESNKGCIFKLDPKGGGYDVLAEFSEEIGSSPNGDVVLAQDGCIYGFTKVNGEFGKGSVFKFTPETNKLEAIYYFNPEAPFMQDHHRVYRLSYDGNNKIFFSTEPNESSVHKGFLMSFNIETLEMEMIVNYYETSASDAIPRLTFYGDRILGFAGDESNNGFAGVFGITSHSNEIEFLNHVYNIESAMDGYNPIWLCQAGNGDIYGMTYYGGKDDKGVLFSIDYSTHEFQKLKDLTDYGYDILIRKESFLLDNGNVLGFISKKEDDVWSNLKAVEFNPFNLEFEEVFSFPDTAKPHYDIRMNSDGNLYYTSGSPLYSIYELELDTYALNKMNIGTDSAIRNICEGNTGIYYGMTNQNIFKWYRTENKLDYIFNNNYFGNYGVGNFVNDIYVTNDERLFGAVREFDSKPSWLNSFTYFVSNDSVSEYSYLGNDFHVSSYKTYLENENLNLLVINQFGVEKLQVLDYKNDSLMEIALEDCPYESGWHYIPNEGWDYDGGDAPFQNKPVTGLISVKPKENKYYWTGNQDSLWYNQNNWYKGKMPEEDEQILIADAAENYPYIDESLELADLYIQKDAKINIAPNGALTCAQITNNGVINLFGNKRERGSLILENTNEEGQINYTYQGDSAKETVLALPVKKMSYTSLDSLNIWNYQNKEWHQIQDTNEMLDCHQVYKFEIDSNLQIQFSGNANMDNVEFEFEDFGLQPIPNPYTASLNWDEINLSGLSHKAHYRFIEEDSTFNSYVDGLGNGSPLIQPLDVVWVYAEPNENVEMETEKLMHAYNFNPNEDTPENKLVLKASGAGGDDFTYISFNPNATAGLDKEYDAFKYILSVNKRPSIFTYADTNKLSINQLPDTTMLDLGVSVGLEGMYSISIDEALNFDFVVLEDLILHTKTDLLKEDYNFKYFTSDGNYPFRLYFKKWAQEPLNESDIDMYFYLDKLVLSSRKQIEKADIVIYDLVGRAVLEFQEQDFFYFEEKVDIPAGHYVVQVRSNDFVKNLKIFVL